MTESHTRPLDEPDDRPVICPFCGSDETEPHAMFGSLMLMEQHYCRACRTVFERVRDDRQPTEPEDSGVRIPTTGQSYEPAALASVRWDFT